MRRPVPEVVKVCCLAVTLGLFATVASFAQETHTISGVVRDQKAGHPIRGVRVEVYTSLFELLDSTYTDSAGRFVLRSIPTSVNGAVEKGIPESFAVAAYPNPTSGVVNLHVNADRVQYTLINQRGRVIARFTGSARDGTARIDLSRYNLADGIVFIVAEDGKSRYVSRVTYLRSAAELRTGARHFSGTLRKSAFDSLDVILRYSHPDYVERMDTVRLDRDVVLEVFLERKRQVRLQSLYPDSTPVANARYEITNAQGEKQAAEADTNGVARLRLGRGRYTIKPADERLREIPHQVWIESDTTLCFVDRVRFVRLDSVVQGEEDSTRLVDIRALFKVPAGVDSFRVRALVPDSILGVEKADSATIRLIPGKDRNMENSTMEFLVTLFSHGDLDSGKVRFDVEPRSDLDWIVWDVVRDTVLTFPKTKIELIGQGKDYVLYSDSGRVVGQVRPGVYQVKVSNDSTHTPFVLKMEDGQWQRSMPRHPDVFLKLGRDLEGKIYMIHHSFDTEIYGIVWDNKQDQPFGVDLWKPPKDKSLPEWITPLDSMGIDAPTDTNIVNVYIYLGEDEEHRLQPPFDILRERLGTMPDSTVEYITNFVTTALDSFINEGLEPEERYVTNIYVGREPPLLWVRDARWWGGKGIRPKVGWHVIYPYDGYFHSEEVNGENEVYAATSFLNASYFDEEGIIEEISQTRGPRNDVDHVDATPEQGRTTFFSVYHKSLRFTKEDHARQRVSNIFGPGFSFRE